jgi:hypothetical protein
MAENDFDSMFAEASAEVEAGGGVSGESKKQNAVIHLGDGEVIDPQASDDEGLDLDGGDDSDVDEEDTEDDSDDESFSDETSDDDEDEPLKFDLQSHANELVTIKVNGEELSVPLSEVANGYMRQADYTRKTQEIAELRKAAEWGKQMRDALLEDPEGLINSLAQAMNVQVNATADAESNYETDDPELAPLANRLKELEAENKRLAQFVDAQRQEAIDREVRAELEAVKAKYPDFDPHEVLPIAIQRQLGIEEAYLLVSAKKGVEARKTQTEVSQKVTDTASKEIKKRKANQAISKGAKRNAPELEPAIKGDSFADMFSYALLEGKKK